MPLTASFPVTLSHNPSPYTHPFSFEQVWASCVSPHLGTSSLLRVQVSWLCCSSCGVPIPFWTCNPSSYSSVRVPKLHLLFGCCTFILVGYCLYFHLRVWVFKISHRGLWFIWIWGQDDRYRSILMLLCVNIKFLQHHLLKMLSFHKCSFWASLPNIRWL